MLRLLYYDPPTHTMYRGKIGCSQRMCEEEKTLGMSPVAIEHLCVFLVRAMSVRTAGEEGALLVSLLCSCESRGPSVLGFGFGYSKRDLFCICLYPDLS